MSDTVSPPEATSEIPSETTPETAAQLPADSNEPPTIEAPETTQAQANEPAESTKAVAGKRTTNKPSPRAAQPLLERLFALYPKMFGARFLPLKLGVFHDLMERHPTDFAKEDLKVALGLHTRSTRYLESVAAGHARHDLDANRVEDIAPEHVHHAIVEIGRRRAGRGKDATAWVHERLVAVIETSGLSREDYEALVAPKDDATLAALDKAFGEIREKHARSEALRRAFESSGKTVAQFADMYGMAPGEVRKLLGLAKETP
ncbi:MAG: prop effector [Ramlibacter sp.]|nr:prop effector [Ramlibacter sp.]